MGIAMNPAVNENRQKQRAHCDPKGGDEQRGKNGKYAHCQNDSLRYRQHRRIPQERTVAWFARAAILILGAFSLTDNAFASTTSVTATLIDSDVVVWANCSWSATLVSPKGGPTISNTAVALTAASGICNNAGALSASLTDTTSLDQSGAYWIFTVQSNALSGPSVISTAVSGSSESLSTILSAGLSAPRFFSSSDAYGYSNAEVKNPIVGSLYFNVSFGGYCEYGQNSAWICPYSSGSQSSLIGSSVASATTIALVAQLTPISGTATIITITPPPNYSSTIGGCTSLLATGAWSTTTGGNIAASMTAVSGTPYQACWYGTAWYIK